MQRKGYILDCDGTIVSLDNGRYLPIYANLMKDILSKRTGTDHSNLDEWDLYPLVSKPFSEACRILRDMGIEDHDDFYQELALRDYTERKKRIGSKIEKYEETEEFLSKVTENGNMKAIVSNTPFDIVMMELTGLGLDKFFDKKDIFCFCYNEPNSKPSPWGINEIIRKHGITRECVYMIGDSSTDVESGKAAGVKTCLLNRPGEYHHKDIDPDFEGEYLMDFEEIL